MSYPFYNLSYLNESDISEGYGIVVTINMIEEHLNGCSLVYLPSRRTRSFAHLVPLEAAHALDADAPCTSETLFFGTPADAIAFTEGHPQSWILCIYPPDDAFDATTLPLERTILCCTEEPVNAIQGRLAVLFSAISEWVMSMKSALLQGGSYQSLLDCSEHILKNFIAISDSEFKLMAYTQHTSIDDPDALDLVKNGRHSAEVVERFKRQGVMRTWETQARTEVKPAEITKHPVMDHVFRTHGSYFLHVVMQCNHVPATPALRDALQLLIDHIDHCVRQGRDAAFPLDSEPSRLFDDLISRRPIPRSELERRLVAAGIRANPAFQLLVMAFPDNAEEAQYLSYHAARAKRAFTTCHIGIQSTYVLVLDPSATLIDDRISQLQAFVNMHPCIVGVSERFDHMDEFANAFQQARSAAALATREPASLAQHLSGPATIPIYRFKDSFAAYVADVAATNNRLVTLAARNGIVAQIARFDAAHGSFDVKVLHTYLRNERNVRKTCEELFIHRSTLLYRVRRMQERFAFDLDDPSTRERILMEYLILPKDEALPSHV